MKLENLSTLLAAATPGPWRAIHDTAGIETATSKIWWPGNALFGHGVDAAMGSCGTDAEGRGVANLDLIVALVNAAPQLLAIARAAQAVRESLGAETGVISPQLTALFDAIESLQEAG